MPQQMAFTLPDDTGALVRLLVWQGLCEAQPGRRRKWGAKGSGPFSTEAAVRPMGTQRTWRPLGRKRCQFRFRDPVPALGIPRPNTKRLEASVPRCPGSGCHQQKALLSVFGPPPRSPDSDALGQPGGGAGVTKPPPGGGVRPTWGGHSGRNKSLLAGAWGQDGRVGGPRARLPSRPPQNHSGLLNSH